VQDYKEAARLRDSLRSFEEEEPVLRLRGLMRKAIEEERFEVFYSCIAVVSSNQIASLSRFSSYTSGQALALAKFGNIQLQPLSLMVLIKTKI